MLVTTATSGVYSSSEPSLSSASATKHVPLPWWALVPASPRSPPTANDGSNPVCCNATMSIDVVVVLPACPSPSAWCSRPSAWPAPRVAGSPGYRGAAPRRARGWSWGSRRRWSPPRSVRRAAGPARTRRGRCGSPRPAHAAPPRRATPWRRSPIPARRGRAGCGRCRTCPLRRCRPCAPASARSGSEIALTGRAFGSRATSRATSATFSAASRWPAIAAAAVIAVSRGPSDSSPATVSPTNSGVRSASSTSSPPPALTTGSALSRCSPLPIGSGTYTAGSPTADTSATVIAPDRQIAKSAAA